MEQNKELQLNNLGEQEQDLDPPEQQETTPINNREAQESIQLKLPNGLEIGLSSSTFQVDNLCDMALFMIKELNGKEKPQSNPNYVK